MCYVCCKEFKGWCKSFTRIEAFLTILEVLLLVGLFSFLIFLILHFMVCPKKPELEIPVDKTPPPTSTPHEKPKLTPFPPQIECTWKPSEKTPAITHYYIIDDQTKNVEPTTKQYTDNAFISAATEYADMATPVKDILPPSPEYEDILLEESDGEYAEDMYKKYVLALVKLKPPGDLTFGCILTIITKHWTLTAASCIEAIEEVDSLDSFFMIEDYGEARRGRGHALADVRIHPFYRGVNASHDLAALGSEDALVRGYADTVKLPTAVDYSLVAIGERFDALGFGAFRTIEGSRPERRLRRAGVFSLPAAACAGAGFESWAPRHLAVPEPARPARACSAGALCCGALWARGAACGQCGGTPLLRGATLFGIMSRNRQCGITCEPQLYVNLAVLRDWIDSVLDE